MITTAIAIAAAIVATPGTAKVGGDQVSYASRIDADGNQLITGTRLKDGLPFTFTVRADGTVIGRVDGDYVRFKVRRR